MIWCFSFDLGRGPRVELVKLAGLWHVHVGDEELAGACEGYRESLAVAARRLREEPDGEWATATLDALADASLASLSAQGSRVTGHDMQRGPPRPVPSSEPAIGSTSIPSCSRRALVSRLRS